MGEGTLWDKIKSAGKNTREAWGSLTESMTGKTLTTGGSRRRRNRTLKGGSMSIGAAIVPVGLLALQKYFQTRKRPVGNSTSKWRKRRSMRRSNRIKLQDETV